MRFRFLISMLGVVAVIAGSTTQAVEAGCGCQKPPPPLTVVRPYFGSSGTAVTFTHPSLVAGDAYVATFASGGQSAAVEGIAISQRDLADGQVKPQLVVALPTLPVGPATITLRAASSNATIVSLTDRDFTVLGDALAIPAARGAWTFSATQAAVSRDGIMYLALDLNGLQEPLIFQAQAVGYPLRFDADDVVFYNSQGYVMQQLVDVTSGKARPVPGMFVKPALLPLLESDILNYSRHEFATYFLQHEERQAHFVDAAGWHADGTPHIDHNRLIIAIHGRGPLGLPPVAGATPPFNLNVKAYSIFHAGLVGTDKVEVKDTAQTDSYDGTTMETGNEGDVQSNRDVIVKDTATVGGDVTGSKVTREPRASVVGVTKLVPTSQAPTLMAVTVPAGLPSLGRIELKDRGRIIEGPGSFRVDSIKLEDGATLAIDNTNGPVTLYVSGDVVIEKGSEVTVVDPHAERFAVYVTSDKPVKLAGDGSLFAGVVYAPRSPIEITGAVDFSGAFVGRDVKVGASARVHYDSTLRAADQ